MRRRRRATVNGSRAVKPNRNVASVLVAANAATTPIDGADDRDQRTFAT